MIETPRGQSPSRPDGPGSGTGLRPAAERHAGKRPLPRPHPTPSDQETPMTANRTPVLAALAVCLAFASPPAAAETAEPALDISPRTAIAATLRACRTDAARHCAEIAPGGGRILACLEARRPRLAPACAARLAPARALRTAWLACYADARRHCLAVAPGQGRIAACLAEARPKLAPDCRAALDALR